MIPCLRPVWAVFADGTRVPVVAFSAQRMALIVDSSGELAVASKAPRFDRITTQEN